jgi:anti-sigma regulatory factor (Ser/Thr protein kinase)
VTSTAHAPVSTRQFRHEAAFYRGMRDLVRVVEPFVREGFERDEPVMVVELPDRIRALEDALGTDADRVAFVDMAEVGANPARIIPTWRDFVDAHRGHAVCGVGEPVWPGRTAVELDECRLHESLLNVAFDDVPTEFHLLCPYDADALPGAVLAEAEQSHPVIRAGGPSPSYGGQAHALTQFQGVLPAPPGDAELVRFGAEDLPGLRSVVRRLCEMSRLPQDVLEDLVLAAHELATNSVLHGAGDGVLRGWHESHALVLEIADDGVITAPLVGREQALPLAEGGRGVWMANQLCDLVQVRSSPRGTVVRLHTWL